MIDNSRIIKKAKDKKVNRIIGAKIRECRQKEKLSIRAAANMFPRMSKSTLCRIELGQRVKRVDVNETGFLLWEEDLLDLLYEKE